MLSIVNTTKQRPLSQEADFVAIKNAILGKNYDLSLAFVGATRAQQLNKAHRNKTYVPNILSFPLDDDAGEIFICLTKAQTEAKDFEMSVKNYIRFLFIHGCIHLKGYDHGPEMEKLEQKFSKKFLS